MTLGWAEQTSALGREAGRRGRAAKLRGPRLEQFEKLGRLSGIFDDRGKYIYITEEEPNVPWRALAQHTDEWDQCALEWAPLRRLDP